MNKKNIIIICVSVVIIAVAVVILCFCLGNKKDSKKDNKAELTANLEKLGKSFYEDFYYVRNEEAQENMVEFIKGFEKTGISVDLENISKVSTVDKELVDSMVNSKTKKKCDVKKSKVTFFPKAPYGKTDYDIKVELSCGFDEKKEK